MLNAKLSGLTLRPGTVPGQGSRTPAVDPVAGGPWAADRLQRRPGLLEGAREAAAPYVAGAGLGAIAGGAVGVMAGSALAMPGLVIGGAAAGAVAGAAAVPVLGQMPEGRHPRAAIAGLMAGGGVAAVGLVGLGVVSGPVVASGALVGGIIGAHAAARLVDELSESLSGR